VVAVVAGELADLLGGPAADEDRSVAVFRPSSAASERLCRNWSRLTSAGSSSGGSVVWADATPVRAVPVTATAPRAAAPSPTLRTNRRRDGDTGAVAASDGSSAVSTGWRGLIDISFLFGARSGPVKVLIARSPRPSWSCGWCSSSGTRPAR
jgi:hypothetical protein